MMFNTSLEVPNHVGPRNYSTSTQLSQYKLNMKSVGLNKSERTRNIPAFYRCTYKPLNDPISQPDSNQ
jgi:acyl-CoA hydrolase